MSHFKFEADAYLTSMLEIDEEVYLLSSLGDHLCTKFNNIYESDNYVDLLNAKNAVIMGPFEILYRKILCCLFIMKTYKILSESKDVKPIEYMIDYLKKKGFTRYWEINILERNFPSIPEYFIDDFNSLLSRKELWEGAGLWDFINTCDLQIDFDDTTTNFRFYEEKWKNKCNQIYYKTDQRLREGDTYTDLRENLKCEQYPIYAEKCRVTKDTFIKQEFLYY